MAEAKVDDHKDEDSDTEAIDIFADPEGFYPPSPKPTTETHTLLSGQVLSLRLVGHNPLWGHHLVRYDFSFDMILMASIAICFILLSYFLLQEWFPPSLHSAILTVHCYSVKIAKENLWGFLAHFLPLHLWSKYCQLAL